MSEMKPGRTMDAAVARVLGYQVSDDGRHALIDGLWEELGEFGQLEDPGWTPSQRDADALAALYAFLAQHPEYCVDIASLNDKTGVVGWTCWFTWHEDRKLCVERHAKTVAEAICLAILALAEKEAVR